MRSVASVCVCLSVLLWRSLIISESLDLETSFLVYRYSFRISRWSSYTCMNVRMFVMFVYQGHQVKVKVMTEQQGHIGIHRFAGCLPTIVWLLLSVSWTGVTCWCNVLMLDMSVSSSLQLFLLLEWVSVWVTATLSKPLSSNYNCSMCISFLTVHDILDYHMWRLMNK